MFFDYHLHSTFSADGHMSMDDICTRGLLVGLEEIAITDHIDLDYQNPDITFDLDLPGYLAAVARHQEKYAGALRIKLGLELGLQPHILDQCATIANGPFDFIIGSFHSAQKKDLYLGDFFHGYTQWEAYRHYLKDILDVVQRYDQYSVLGHLDVVRRYGNYPSAPDLADDAECRELIQDIFRNIIARGKGIEINTSGYYVEQQTDPFPTRSILKIYRQLGGEILTTGSDSHYPEQIGYRFSETHQLLRDLGFKYLTTFEKGQPVFHKL